MMAKERSRKRKWLIGLASLLLLAAAIIALLPVWLPWVAAPAAPRFGAEYSAYERLGYGRFALSDVDYASGSIRFTAERVEGFVPTVWLLKRYSKTTAQTPYFLVARDWRLEIESEASGGDEPAEEPPSAPKTPADVWTLVESISGYLRSWIPKAKLERGEVAVAGEELIVEELIWADGQATGSARSTKHGQSARLTLQAPLNRPLTLNTALDPLGATAAVEIREEPDGLQVDGQISWLTNRLELSALIGGADWIPSNASAKIESLRVSGEEVGLADYHVLTGAFDAQWDGARYVVDLQANAEPNPTATNLPPVSLQVEADGDLERVTARVFHVRTPWATIQLAGPASLSYGGKLLNEDAGLAWTADLSQQDWIALTGRLNGSIQASPSESPYPDARFTVTGTELTGMGLDVETQLSAEGRLRWPLAELTSFLAELSDGSRLTARAVSDLSEKTVEEARLEAEGPFAKSFLPENVDYAALSLKAEASGKWEALNHQAELEVSGVEAPSLETLEARLAWQGQGLNLETMDAEIKSPRAALNLRASAEVSTNSVKAELSRLTLDREEGDNLELLEPWTVRAHRAASSEAWAVEAGRFHWAGAGADLEFLGSLRWPDQGKARASIKGLSPLLFQGFSKQPFPDVSIQELLVDGGWRDGPLRMTLSFAAATEIEANPLFARLNARAEPEGLFVEKLEIGSEDQSIITGNAFLGAPIQPASAAGLEIGPKTEFRLGLLSRTNEVFWKEVEARTGARIRRPRISLSASGALGAPRGRLAIEVEAIEKLGGSTNQPLPAVTDLEAQVVLAPEEARVEGLFFRVANQPVVANGRLPLQQPLADNWREQLDWKRAAAELRIDSAEIAAFAKFVPELVAPQGALSVQAELKPGAKVTGEISLEGAATRPVMPWDRFKTWRRASDSMTASLRWKGSEARSAASRFS